MKKVKLVKQTTFYSCGPASLAMIAGSTEQKMLELLGNRFYYGTNPSHMEWALDKLDIMHSDWQRDGLWKMDKVALLHFEYFFDSKKRWFVVRKHPIYGHYVVFANKKYYDPHHGIRNELFCPVYSKEWIRVLGYMTIYR